MLTDSNVLLCCGLFVDLLDPANKFSLVSQKKNFGMELVEELGDMFLAYYFMKQQFERNAEAIFSLPNLHKAMSGVKVEQNKMEPFTSIRTQHLSTMNAKRRVFKEILQSTLT